MAQQIDARVKQKTGTAADFAGYTLLEGEIALVRTSASGPVWNFKVGPGNFDSLDWSLQNPGAAQKADTSTVFPAGVPGLYIPTEDGTYEGVTVDLSAGYTQLIWDGSALVKAEFPIDLSGYATTAEVLNVDSRVEKIETVVSSGNNLIDKSTLIFGRWNENGTITAGSFELRTPLIPIQLGSLTFSGGNAISTAAARFVFFNGDAFVSFSDDLTTTVPASATHVGVTIVYSETMGVDPTNNTYANSAMLNYGTTALPWEPYSVGVDADKVRGLDSEISAISQPLIDASIEPLELELDAVIAAGFDRYGYFDGTAKIDLPQTYTLNVVGDYLEFKSRYIAGYSFERTIGLFGRPVVASDSIGFISPSQINLRENGSALPYVTWSGLTGMEEFRVIRLEVVAGGWDLKIDGVSQGVKTKTSGLLIENVGDGYNPALRAIFDLMSVTISSASGSITITDPYSYPTQENIIPKMEQKPVPMPPIPVIYPDCFVTYLPEAQSGNGQINVFVKRQGTDDIYIGHEIWHQVDTSELVYQDLWRIAKADEYQYDGSAMTKIANYALGPGESECVYRQNTPAKVDFTGGVHGDEIMQKMDLFIDGVKRALSSGFELVPCDTAYYIQQSTMHETANVEGGVVPGHPTQAGHIKITSFFAGGYKTWNKLEWQVAANVFWYHGICCLGKIQATEGINEYYDEATFTGDGLTYDLERVGARLFLSNNETTQKAGEVTSVLISPQALDTTSNIYVDDRPNDSKYYRRTPNTDTTPGDIWIAEMVVKYK